MVWIKSSLRLSLAFPTSLLLYILGGVCVNHLIFSYIIFRVESILAWPCLAEQGLALLMGMKQTETAPFILKNEKASLPLEVWGFLCL